MLIWVGRQGHPFMKFHGFMVVLKNMTMTMTFIVGATSFAR